jgi:hypothetical protein
MAAGKHKNDGKRYLNITYELLERTDVNLAEKVLYSYVFSYGAQGCYESNAGIAKKFGVHPVTISRAMSQLWHIQAIYLFGSEGKSRKAFAITHPDVAKRLTVRWAGRDVNKEDGRYRGEQPTQNVKVDEVEPTQNVKVGHEHQPTQNAREPQQNVKEPTQNVDQPTQNVKATLAKCLTTNITITKGINKNITPTPSPLPAEGQSQASENTRREIDPEEWQRKKELMLRSLKA